MIDYKAEFEAALEARDAAGWIGTSPAETIAILDEELRDMRYYMKMIMEGPWPDGIESPERQAQFDDHVARTALNVSPSKYYAPFPSVKRNTAPKPE